jgi:hypothetical protein
MTNLYDFLRRLLNDSQGSPPFTVNISQAERDWITQFITEPENEIQFKSRRVGGTDEDPIMAQDYRIKGEGVDVFQLVTEAMLANPHWANLVLMAANYFKDHVPECSDCRQALINARENVRTSWNFTPHKTE